MRRAIPLALWQRHSSPRLTPRSASQQTREKEGDYHRYINGDLEKGDFDKFKNVAELPAGKVIVSLNSKALHLVFSIWALPFAP